MKRILIIAALVCVALTSPAQSDNLRRDFAMLIDCHDEVDIFTSNSTKHLVFEFFEFTSNFEAEAYLAKTHKNNDILFFFETCEFEFICISGPAYYRCFSEANIKNLLNL